MFRKKRKRLHKKRVFNRVGLEHQEGRVSLFWNTNMAAMTSCENSIYLLQTVNWFSITPWANVVFFLTFIVCANMFLNLSLCTNVARRKKWRRVNHWMTFLPHFDTFCDLFFFFTISETKEKKKYLSSWCLTVPKCVWNFGFFLVQKTLFGSAFVLFLTFEKLFLNYRQSFAYKFKYMIKQLFFHFSFYR